MRCQCLALHKRCPGGGFDVAVCWRALVCRLLGEMLFGISSCPAFAVTIWPNLTSCQVGSLLELGLQSVCCGSCRCLSCLVWRQGTPGSPKATDTVGRCPLSHKPNPAARKTAGKTPIDLNAIRIRQPETSFQFISY